MLISDWSSDVFSSDLFGSVGVDGQLGGLRYTAAADSTITVGVGNTLGVDGTIIVAPSVLANDQTITGGFLTGGAGGGTLGVQQNGAGTFTIDSTIVDNGGATSFVKGGTGTVVMTKSEESGVGQECVSTCRARWSPKHEKKQQKKTRLAYASH